MKDWNELVLSLIQDLGCYVAWLDDFREGAIPDDAHAIAIDQQKVVAMIDMLRAHKIGEIHPDFEQWRCRWPQAFRQWPAADVLESRTVEVELMSNTDGERLLAGLAGQGEVEADVGLVRGPKGQANR